MGDIKKIRKKYSGPAHPWKKVNIESERVLKQEFGLKNKREIYIAQSFLKKYKDIAKRLIASRTAQAVKEKELVLTKLKKLGLLSASSGLDQILSLELKNILERRVQTLIFRRKLARTVHQARQFITHRHVLISSKEVTSPSRLLSLEEENKMTFKPSSSLSSDNHPERINTAQQIHEEAEAVKVKKKNTKEENEDEGLIIGEKLE